MAYRATIKGYIKAKPTRAQLKAEKQVAKGRERALKNQINSMVQQAKSQIKGIERAGLESTPALEKLRAKTDLTTKGKSYNQLQSTYFALDSFLKSQTATAKGAIENLNQIARTVGMEGATAQEIAQNASKFFAIAKRVQQIAPLMGLNGGSTRIFEAIRQVQKDINDRWQKSMDGWSKVDAVLRELNKQQQTIAEDEFGLYLYDEIGVKD